MNISSAAVDSLRRKDSSKAKSRAYQNSLARLSTLSALMNQDMLRMTQNRLQRGINSIQLMNDGNALVDRDDLLARRGRQDAAAGEIPKAVGKRGQGERVKGRSSSHSPSLAYLVPFPPYPFPLFPFALRTFLSRRHADSESTFAATAHGNNLGHDRQCNLLRRNRADVESNRGMNLSESLLLPRRLSRKRSQHNVRCAACCQ